MQGGIFALAGVALGATLAWLGGVLREHRQEKRRVRAAVRLLGEELERGQAWMDHVVEEGRWVFEAEEVSLTRWGEHGPFLAEHIRDHLVWFTIANGFASLRMLARLAEHGIAEEEPLDEKAEAVLDAQLARIQLALDVLAAYAAHLRESDARELLSA